MPASPPAWWFEYWRLSDWFESWLNQPLEVHTLVLGAITGTILGLITVRCRPWISSGLALVVVFFTFGAFQTDILL